MLCMRLHESQYMVIRYHQHLFIITCVIINIWRYIEQKAFLFSNEIVTRLKSRHPWLYISTIWAESATLGIQVELCNLIYLLTWLLICWSNFWSVDFTFDLSFNMLIQFLICWSKFGSVDLTFAKLNSIFNFNLSWV